MALESAIARVSINGYGGDVGLETVTGIGAAIASIPWTSFDSSGLSCCEKKRETTLQPPSPY